MRQPPKAKPRASEEVERVMRIARMLDEELRTLLPGSDIEAVLPDWHLLATAERIAARTED